MAIGYRVIQNIRRPSPGIVRQLGQHFSADLADAMQKAGAISTDIRPVYSPISRIAGPAVTVSVPTGSFSMAKLAMMECHQGDVLVVNSHGDTQHAMLGGHIGHALVVRGLAGIIVDGAVRDASELREIGLPVFARGTAVVVGGHDGPGEINIPIACGGVVVNPGDILVADEDGIVVIPLDAAEEVLKQVSDLKERHGISEPAFGRGEIPGMAEVEARMRAAGCEYIQHVP